MHGTTYFKLYPYASLRLTSCLKGTKNIEDSRKKVVPLALIQLIFNFIVLSTPNPNPAQATH
jgi:hypothetical protein